MSSCSRACCDCEQNCSFGPPSIRRKWCSALLAHDRGLDRRWRLKGRPPWASPSADKSADPVMMPRLWRLALLCSETYDREGKVRPQVTAADGRANGAGASRAIRVGRVSMHPGRRRPLVRRTGGCCSASASVSFVYPSLCPAADELERQRRGRSGPDGNGA